MVLRCPPRGGRDAGGLHPAGPQGRHGARRQARQVAARSRRGDWRLRTHCGPSACRARCRSSEDSFTDGERCSPWPPWARPCTACTCTRRPVPAHLTHSATQAALQAGSAPLAATIAAAAAHAPSWADRSLGRLAPLTARLIKSRLTSQIPAVARDANARRFMHGACAGFLCKKLRPVTTLTYQRGPRLTFVGTRVQGSSPCVAGQPDSRSSSCWW